MGKYTKEIKFLNGSYFVRITDLKEKYDFDECDELFFEIIEVIKNPKKRKEKKDRRKR